MFSNGGVTTFVDLMLMSGGGDTVKNIHNKLMSILTLSSDSIALIRRELVVEVHVADRDF